MIENKNRSFAVNPTIQMIQLTVRFEHQEKAHSCSFVTHQDDLPNEQPSFIQKQNDRIEHIFNPLQHKQCCQCI